MFLYSVENTILRIGVE